MQQRRLRLGDILDDYCPRERRITNHAVVAMVDDAVKQTRCTTCDADHEYKHARVPPQRRKRAATAGAAPAIVERSEPESLTDLPPVEPPIAVTTAEDEAAPPEAAPDEDGPVHRRLIRATLPRPDGQTPERREPEFTIRQPSFRGRPFEHQNGGRLGRRQAHAHGASHPQRFPSRHGSGQGPRHGSGQAPRQGSGQGSGGPGFRPSGNRPGHPGGPRGPRHGAGRGGRKRGR
ncbi:MAG: hypothetical protein HYU37_18625 [Acidobacteria bacterium]|nr:hypothetical protein [Acidobacteriota bacterium]